MGNDSYTDIHPVRGRMATRLTANRFTHMDPEEIKRLIQAGLPNCEVMVKGDGSHFDAIIVGEVFAGKSLVKQQQLVYATVNDRIRSGELHALSIKTYTPAEWETARKLRVS